MAGVVGAMVSVRKLLKGLTPTAPSVP